MSGQHSHPEYAAAFNDTLFGSTTWPPRAGRTEQQELAFLEDKLGRQIDLRYSFSKTLPGDYAVSPMKGDPRWSMWSFKFDPATVIAGQLDSAWQMFLGSLPEELDTRVIYYQEPEDNMPPDQFTAAFDRLYGLINRDDVRFGVNLSSWLFNEAYIPRRVDFVGLSLFTNGPDPNVLRDPLGKAAAAVNGMLKPFALSSVGVSYKQTTSAVARWFDHLARFTIAQRTNQHPLDHVVCYSGIKDTWPDYGNTYMDGSPDTAPNASAALLQGWRDLVDVLR